MPQIILLILCWFITFIMGIGLGQNTRKEKLEQELCKLEQYKYCTKEELLKLKTIK